MRSRDIFWAAQDGGSAMPESLLGGLALRASYLASPDTPLGKTVAKGSDQGRRIDERGAKESEQIRLLVNT